MKQILLTVLTAFFSYTSQAQLKITRLVGEPECDSSIAPAMVDFDAYEKLIAEVKQHRKKNMVDFKQFMKTSKEQNVVILDTRSDSMYKAKHIKDAIHLNFSDFTQSNLRRLIPDPSTKILIYCNNNFKDDQRYFMTKAVFPSSRTQKALTLALNIPTYINLYGYGYRNVYELSEMISVTNPFIEFEGTTVTAKRAIVSR